MIMKNLHKILFLFLMFFIIGCGNDDYKPEGDEYKIDRNIEFKVLWDKEIKNSSRDAIFFDRYFIILNSNDEMNIYSKETGDLVVKIDKSIMSGTYYRDLLIIGNYLYTYSYDSSYFYKFNLLTKEIAQRSSTGFVNGFNIDKNDLYYSTKKGVFKTNFDSEHVDTIYKYIIPSSKFNVNFINLKFYKSEQKNINYLILTFMAQKYYHTERFHLKVFDLNHNEGIIIDESFNMLDNRYKTKIQDDNLCISSLRMIYIYDFIEDEYYFENSNYDINYYKNVNVSTSGPEKYVQYYNTIDFNCYDFHEGNIKWTLKNRYNRFIKNVSNLNMNSIDYLNLLKENSLNLVNLKTGKINAEFKYVVDGETKYFRECSDVFDENNVILRIGNDRIVKVRIVKK